MVSARILRTAELACWCVGIALVAAYFGLRAEGEVERRAAISAFTAAASVETPPPPLTYGAPDQAHWSEGRIRAYAAAETSTGETPGLPVAVLRIRRVGLEVPVYSQETAQNLNRGAVLVAGTAAPDTGGNTAIAAHRDGYFRTLKNVVVGDVLSVQTLSRLQRYRVTSLEIVKPTDVSVLHQTPNPVVTLVTCYPFYFVGSAPRRYIVRAVALQGTGRQAGASAVRKSPVSGAADVGAARLHTLESSDPREEGNLHLATGSPGSGNPGPSVAAGRVLLWRTGPGRQ